MPACFDLRRDSRQRLSTVARAVAANVSLFCNGLAKSVQCADCAYRLWLSFEARSAQHSCGSRLPPPRKGFLSKASLRPRSCFDASSCWSDAVENLEAPQHDDDGRNQGGNGQHTLQGSYSHDTLRFPTPSSGLVDSRNRRQSGRHNCGDVILRLWFAGHSSPTQQKGPALRGLLF
jgi:hypothetical protein